MKTLIIILLFPLWATAQFSLSAAQDVRLATIGDDKGNNPFTANLTSRLAYKIQGKPFNATFYFEHEYADLSGGDYNRYNFGTGVNFDRWVKNFEFQLSLGIGYINRNGENYAAYTIPGQVIYKLNKNLGLLIEAEATKRNDLKKQPFILSGKAGLVYYFK